MLIIIKSTSSLKLGHVGSKSRSLDQTLEKHCVHSIGLSFDSKSAINNAYFIVFYKTESFTALAIKKLTQKGLISM